MIRAIEWTDQGIVMIDQRLLPGEERFNTYKAAEEVAQAIKTMVIRGAPAIGLATAMGIALGLENLSSKEGIHEEFERICGVFRGTRPTTRNLAWAIERMRVVFEESQELPLGDIQRRLRFEALRICDEDVQTNRWIGRRGQALLKNGSTVLTHCNTGALATAGYGTALGIIRAAVENGKNLKVFADETRPLLQGARLTSWEMTKEKIPCTLITDSMAGFFMQSGRIDAVIVGADRIARNGDVANKIGTYTLAVLAKEHKIPFYVASPFSTFDLDTASGEGIPIEERDPEEITAINGRRIAPESVEVLNPAFDITPHQFVTAIVTERGIARSPYEESILRLFEKAENIE